MVVSGDLARRRQPCFSRFAHRHSMSGFFVRGVRPRAPRGYTGRRGRLPPTIHSLRQKCLDLPLLKPYFAHKKIQPQLGPDS